MVAITNVLAHSVAQKKKIMPGDVLMTINGHTIEDVLDYRFYLTDTSVVLELKRGETFQTVTIHKQMYDDIGLEFETPLMDEKRSCQNGCVFCFIDQLPGGMRSSLYFKDDDSRLSFLHGNYITMTNLKDKDIDRIIQMHMSPVNVSVHTTNEELRVKMMRNKNAGKVLSYLKRLADANIAINGQIVLCKGLNDKDELMRSMKDLTDYYPALQSVSIVPVGLTDHREGLYPLEEFDKEDATAVIQQVTAYGEECLRQYGTRLFYLADEWYIKAGMDLPDEAYYEGYPQIENGVGMLTSLSVEVTDALSKMTDDTKRAIAPWSVSVCAGWASYCCILELCEEIMYAIPQVHINVYPVTNYFFGKNVTVSGLLTGKDIKEQLIGKDLGKIVFFSSSALRYGEDVFLDDQTVGDVSQALGTSFIPVPNDGYAFVSALTGQKTKEN